MEGKQNSTLYTVPTSPPPSTMTVAISTSMFQYDRKKMLYNGKDYKLTTDFETILTFSLARGFDLVLSLGVTTPLITLVMGIS